jgi:hypothetical protein
MPWKNSIIGTSRGGTGSGVAGFAQPSAQPEASEEKASEYDVPDCLRGGVKSHQASHQEGQELFPVFPVVHTTSGVGNQ